MDKYYHRTNNLDAIASSGKISALKHLVRNNPDIEIEVEPRAGGSNLGGLLSDRARMRVADAYSAMSGVKDVDNVFLTRSVLPSKSYGKYVIEKTLLTPKLNTKLNLIANEYISPRELSVRYNANVYAPDDEVQKLREDHGHLNILPMSDLTASEASLADHARTLYAKLTKSASMAGILGTAGAGALLYANRDRLLGYHKVFHGTSGAAAESIINEGLDPNWGGKGGAAEIADRGDFVEQSKGKVHFSKLRRVARGYADTVDPDSGVLLKAYIPHRQWDNAEVDSDASWGANSNKNVAATTSDKITVQNLKAKASDYLNLDNLSDYYSTESGRDRAIAGIGISVAGGTALGFAAKNLLKTLR